MDRSTLRFSLAACALVAGCMTVSAQPMLRVMVKLRQASTNSESVVRLAQAASGTTVDYLAAVSPQWHSLGLHCADAERCDTALQGLRADTLHFEAVERESRARPQTPAS